MTRDASVQCTDEVFGKMSVVVSQAVSDTLGLDGPHQVVAYGITAERTVNANAVQVLVIASASESRLTKLVDLRDAVGVALQTLSEDEECAAFFSHIGHSVESWPIMPSGSWGEFPV